MRNNILQETCMSVEQGMKAINCKVLIALAIKLLFAMTKCDSQQSTHQSLCAMQQNNVQNNQLHTFQKNLSKLKY